MVRTSGTKISAPAPAVPATPAKKASTSKKTSSSAKEEEPVISTEPVEEENKMIVETLSETATKLSELTAQVQQMSTILAAAKSNLKTVEKLHNKDLKAAQKAGGKKKKRDGTNRKPSGFNIPTLISDELAAFLGKPLATKMARVEVTNAFNTYIKANSLHDPTNGRYIIPDAALTRLLKLTPADRLSYFNLQAFIKHHFIKETPVPAA